MVLNYLLVIPEMQNSYAVVIFSYKYFDTTGKLN